MHIIDLASAPDALKEAAARLIHEVFNHANYDFSWDDMDDAREEVDMLCETDNICRVALNDNGEVIGLIGGLPEYEGNVWELHPLVVAPEHQRQGVGRALVRDLEDRVRERGGLTVQLGSDDITGQTSLGGADLYTDLWQQIANIRNLNDHPYSFYEKLGYVIIGVIPDANGIGKPDIYMAKRVKIASPGADAPPCP